MREMKKKFEKRKSFEEVDLRIRVSLALIPCREIETLKLELINYHKRRYKVYIEDKVVI